MPIEIHLDRILVERKMTLLELSRRVGVTNVNLSKLKTGKVNGIRFSTLEAICDVLDCQPGDIMEFRRDSDEEKEGKTQL
jgi:putative transcriptional regulator